jgi:hypothetical protein
MDQITRTFIRWGFCFAIIMATLSILFLGAFYAITGLSFILQPFMEMIGGCLLPGKPMANMYFVLFSYSVFLLYFVFLKFLLRCS